MTRDDLDATLTRLAAAAASVDPVQGPGLITVETSHWLDHLSVVRATCSSLQDGMRYRNIKVQISSAFETQVLTRAEAGARGEPYRDLMPEQAVSRAAGTV